MPEDEKSRGRGHAVTVIGYNDSVNGGSFRVLNSWGEGWGKDGTTWIRYKDFDRITYYAFDLIDSPADAGYELAGKLNFIDGNGMKMAADFNGKYFLMKKSYPSGTKFQVYLNNNNSAYVYAFGTDLKKNTFKIFPPDEHTSALLPYKKNNIALPDEYHYTMLDDVKGKSQYIFVYSKNELDIDKVINNVKTGKEQVYDILAKQLGPQKKKTFTGGETLNFHSGTEEDIVYLIVEFKHI